MANYLLEIESAADAAGLDLSNPQIHDEFVKRMENNSGSDLTQLAKGLSTDLKQLQAAIDAQKIQQQAQVVPQAPVFSQPQQNISRTVEQVPGPANVTPSVDTLADFNKAAQQNIANQQNEFQANVQNNYNIWKSQGRLEAAQALAPFLDAPKTQQNIDKYNATIASVNSQLQNPDSEMNLAFLQRVDNDLKFAIGNQKPEAINRETLDILLAKVSNAAIALKDDPKQAANLQAKRGEIIAAQQRLDATGHLSAGDTAGLQMVMNANTAYDSVRDNPKVHESKNKGGTLGTLNKAWSQAAQTVKGVAAPVQNYLQNNTGPLGQGFTTISNQLSPQIQDIIAGTALAGPVGFLMGVTGGKNPSQNYFGDSGFTNTAGLATVSALAGLGGYLAGGAGLIGAGDYGAVTAGAAIPNAGMPFVETTPNVFTDPGGGPTPHGGGPTLPGGGPTLPGGGPTPPIIIPPGGWQDTAGNVFDALGNLVKPALGVVAGAASVKALLDWMNVNKPDIGNGYEVDPNSFVNPNFDSSKDFLGKVWQNAASQEAPVIKPVTLKDAAISGATDIGAVDPVTASKMTAQIIDQAKQEEWRQKQIAQTGLLQDQISGRTPTAANLMLAGAYGQNANAIQSASMSDRSNNPGLMLRNLTSTLADLNQNKARELTIQKAQETGNLQQLLNSILGQGREQDLGLASAQAGLGQQAEQVNAGLAQQASITNQAAQLQRNLSLADLTQQNKQFNAGQANANILSQGNINQQTALSDAQNKLIQQQVSQQAMQEAAKQSLTLDQQALAANVTKEQIQAQAIAEAQKAKAATYGSTLNLLGGAISGGATALTNWLK